MIFSLPAIPVINYLSVIKASQYISFGEIEDHSVGDFPSALDANSSSGLTLNLLHRILSKATIKDGFVYVHGLGLVTISAIQKGDRRFEPAESIDQNFSIGYGNLFSDSAPGLKLWFDANDINADNEPDDICDFYQQSWFKSNKYGAINQVTLTTQFKLLYPICLPGLPIA